MKALLNFIITRKYYERDAAYLALIDSFIQVRVFYWFFKVSFGMMGFKQDTLSPQSLRETKILEDCWIIYSLIPILNTLTTLLRILLKQNTAILSTVRPCTGVTSHISHIYKGIHAVLSSEDPSSPIQSTAQCPVQSGTTQYSLELPCTAQ